MNQTANIPMQYIGPIKLIGPHIDAEVTVPLATYETPLWPSTHRGARVSVISGGINITLVDDKMTRSILLEAPDATQAQKINAELASKKNLIQKAAKKNSRFVNLTNWHTQIVGNLFYLRLEFTTGDASGHNMVTQAADNVINYLLEEYSNLKYVSISGNYCTDKKTSAVNGILGRGKYVIAELTIDRKTCQRYLKTTPEKMVALNLKKNLIGSIMAGSLRSANSHFANMLLALYLATGQDAANIIEGSQGITHADIQNDKLYFSVTLPNIIVGSVGNGKQLDFVQENLKHLGCTENQPPGKNAQRLAMIAAGTVLCGELSCLAAQTNPGELMKSHVRLERVEGEACA